MTPEVQQDLVARGIGRREPYPRDRTLGTLFAEQVAAAPDAPAVVHDGTELSYAELDRRATDLAAALQQQGLASRARVAVLMDRSVDFVALTLAIIKAGGSYVPLDTGSPPTRIRSMLEQAGCLAVVGHPSMRDHIRDSIVPFIDIEQLADPNRCASFQAPRDITSLDEAYVMFTSGSTGEPKGVRVPHRAIVRLAHGGEIFALGAGSTTALLSNTAFDASTFELWCPLLHGGRIAVIGPETPTLATLRDRVRHHDVSCMFLSAGLFNTIIDEEPGALSSVPCVIVGGDALSPAHVRRAQACLPQVDFVNGYGPTECTTFSVLHPIPRDLDDQIERVPIGRPLWNSRVYILDDDLAPVSEGASGQLWIGGDGVALGYVADPALTDARFVDDPFHEDIDARMYRSGDLCCWRSDDTIDFIGRVDRQVKLRGFRIEPAEIEAVLGLHPAVRQCVVLLRDELFSAYVVAAPNARIDPTALREHAAASLPDYMVPHDVLVVERIPLTRNGKVDRLALMSEMALAPTAHRASAPEARPERTLPRNRTEEELTALWREVLGTDEIGVHDSFFDLGGHSLRAMVLGARIRTTFGRDLGPAEVLRYPTIAEQAEWIEGASPDRKPPESLFDMERADSAPTSFGQRRMWYMDQVEGAGIAYNEAWALGVHAPVDAIRLRRCVEILIERHPILRTVYRAVDGDVHQVVGQCPEVPLNTADLSPPGGDGALRERINEEARRPFDLARGPLLRMTLIRVATDHHVVVAVLHHICCDDWSMRTFVEEMAELYDAPGEPTALSLPALQLDYRHFAARERAGRLESRQDLREFWRMQLADARLTIPLGTDRPRSSPRSFRGGTVEFMLDAETARRLIALARSESASPFMVFLALFCTLLHRQTREEDLVLASPISLRNRSEFIDMFGYFLNTVPIRIDCAGNPTFRALVRQVRETALQAIDHAELPLESILAQTNVARTGTNRALFNVAFVWLDDPSRAPSFAGAKTYAIPVRDGSAKFELTLALRPTGTGGIGCNLEYCTDLFDPATIEALRDQFLGMSELLAREPDTPVGRLASPSLGQLPPPSQLRESDDADTVTEHVTSGPRSGASPATREERELLGLWREVLERPALGIDDDFFDAGGHSLLAMRLIARIERATGTTLPLNAILQAPTVRSQARYIQSDPGVGKCVLVPVQPHGSQPPLVFAPGLGGSAFVIPELHDRLGDDQPLYAVAMTRVDAECTIEGIAAEHVRCLREVWPDGPFRLAGFSLGGTIAFETARQLDAAGVKVELLAIVDQGPFARWGFRSALGALVNIPFWLRETAGRSPSALADSCRLKLRTTAKHALNLVRARDRREPVVAEDFVDLSGYSPDQRQIANRSVAAMQRYRPQAYSGSIVVFRARRQALLSPVESDMGWGRVAGGRVRVHVIPGGHMASMQPAGFDRFAERLSTELSALREDTGLV